MTYYEVLEVYPSTDHEEIKHKYYALSKIHHPDNGGDTEIFSRIAAAATVLLDPQLRKLYDAKLRLTMQPCKQCDGLGSIAVFNTPRQTCRFCEGVGFHARH